MNYIDRKTFLQSGLAMSAGLALMPLLRNATAASKAKTMHCGWHQIPAKS
jgi:hypothetical protein